MFLFHLFYLVAFSTHIYLPIPCIAKCSCNFIYFSRILMLFLLLFSNELTSTSWASGQLPAVAPPRRAGFVRGPLQRGKYQRSVQVPHTMRDNKYTLSCI